MSGSSATICVTLFPIAAIESAGGSGMGRDMMAVTTARTWSSTALMRPAFVAKWCCTRPSDTPAAAATVRSDVADVPYVAKLFSAASRIRSILAGALAPTPSASGSTVVIHTPRDEGSCRHGRQYICMVDDDTDVLST